MLNIVILAAGKGSRMHSSLPKVLHHLAGEPLLGHVISTAQQLIDHYGGRICVVTGHGANQVDPFVQATDAEVVHQHEQLGTGHALRIALNDAPPEGQTLVLYGDVPLIRVSDLEPLLTTSSDQLGVLTAHVDNPSGYGRIIRDANGSIIGIVEHRDATVNELQICEINSGIYAAPTALFQELLPQLPNDNAQSEYYLTDCVRLAVNSGKVVQGVEGPIMATMGVNDRAQLAALNHLLQTERRAALMAQGVTLVNPDTVYINGIEISIGSDTVIEPNVTLNGPIVIGYQVTIGFGSYLTGATIGDGTVIKPYTVIDTASVGSMAQVGPFARLRPGTNLGNSTHIGNFCEIKNATVGEGSKVNHLSYVGDAILGQDVNIGAGTITCNYDGAQKHQTTIGNAVFVGSNTSLVAPVSLGDGVTTGAGSVITTDVEPQSLALSRSKQLNIQGYQRPKKSKD